MHAGTSSADVASAAAVANSAMAMLASLAVGNGPQSGYGRLTLGGALTRRAAVLRADLSYGTQCKT